VAEFHREINPWRGLKRVSVARSVLLVWVGLNEVAYGTGSTPAGDALWVVDAATEAPGYTDGSCGSPEQLK